jgi:hypothetical protein
MEKALKNSQNLFGRIFPQKKGSLRASAETQHRKETYMAPLNTPLISIDLRIMFPSCPGFFQFVPPRQDLSRANGLYDRGVVKLMKNRTKLTSPALAARL